MKKKILLFILSLCLLVPFTSCNEKKDEQINKDRYKYDGLTRETAADSIPYEYNLDNQTIGVFYAQHIESHVIGDDDTQDIVFSKIHERNLSVQERLNVKLDFIPSNTSDWSDVPNVLQTNIQTMSTAWEIVFTSDTTLMPFKLFNYFHNLNDAEYIDITERWWYEDAIMELSVDNYNYRFLYGDIVIDDLGDAGCIYYNKELYSQYISPNKTTDDPYNMVLNGTWTMEEFTRQTKKGFVDRGGDGSNNTYGFIITHNQIPHYYRESVGIKSYERNEQGVPVFTLNNEKTVHFTRMLYSLFFENEGVMDCVYSGASLPSAFKDPFTNSKAIFDHGKIRYVLFDNYREMEDDFGILPFPKWDEEQQEYISLVHTSSTTVCCPVSADIDRVNEECSAVIEALASESYRSVAVPFYETALKTTYNRDDLSAQMIDIITGQHPTVKSKITKNFVFEYTKSLGDLGNIFYTLMYNKSTDFVSLYDSILPVANEGLKLLIQQYKDGTI